MTTNKYLNPNDEIYVIIDNKINNLYKVKLEDKHVIPNSLNAIAPIIINNKKYFINLNNKISNYNNFLYNNRSDYSKPSANFFITIKDAQNFYNNPILKFKLNELSNIIIKNNINKNTINSIKNIKSWLKNYGLT